jgi:hypothetical protein
MQARGPAGFADTFRKVKPAVISVRVKLKGDVSSLDSSSGDSEDQGRHSARASLRAFFPFNGRPARKPVCVRAFTHPTGEGEFGFIEAL